MRADRQTARLPYAVAPPLGIINRDGVHGNGISCVLLRWLSKKKSGRTG